MLEVIHEDRPEWIKHFEGLWPELVEQCKLDEDREATLQETTAQR
jgi:hypothetical protein